MERNKAFFNKKYWLPHPSVIKFTKYLGLSSKECTYLGGGYFLFTCQRSESILSCLLCVVCSLSNHTTFLKEVRIVALLQFPETLLESLPLDFHCSGKMREDNLLDIFKLRISHILDSVRNVTFTFPLPQEHV